VKIGDRVNLEIDTLARYVACLLDWATRSRRSRRSSRMPATAGCSSSSITRTARTRAIWSSPRRWHARGDQLHGHPRPRADLPALPGARIDALGLPLMSTKNSSRHETAFTVSIEAREGVTTGISAHDRARTVAVAIDPTKGAADIATPGPCLSRCAPARAACWCAPGHTEAAVDIARLAGLNPSGVICEIMNEDGTMARLPDLSPSPRSTG
jgi:hypothetical protein